MDHVDHFWCTVARWPSSLCIEHGKPEFRNRSIDFQNSAGHTGAAVLVHIYTEYGDWFRDSDTE